MNLLYIALFAGISIWFGVSAGKCASAVKNRILKLCYLICTLAPIATDLTATAGAPISNLPVAVLNNTSILVVNTNGHIFQATRKSQIENCRIMNRR